MALTAKYLFIVSMDVEPELEDLQLYLRYGTRAEYL